MGYRMLIKIDIENEVFKKIRHLVDEGRYDDLHQFVTIAIINQIQEEQSKGESAVSFFSQQIPLADRNDTTMFSET
ncbi:MAG: hypothetical protein ACREAE_05820, partial [Nitrosopumilaceae archaeon]